MFVIAFLHFLSSYVNSFHNLMFTDERKYSRPHRPDVSPYAFDGNGVLFMNCKKQTI